MKSVRNQTLSGVKWTAIEKFSLQGINFVMGLILARLLSPSDFGIIGMLAIFMSVGQTFIDSGFGNALIRKNNRTDIDSSTVFYFNIGASVFAYSILFLIAPYVAVFFELDVLKDVLRVLSLVLIINSFRTVQQAQFTIAVDFKSQAKVTLSASLLSGFSGILFAYAGFGVWSLVYQQLVNAILATVIIWCLSKWRPMLCFSMKSFKELGSYGSKLLGANILSTVYSELTTLIIGKCYSPTQLGYYSRGNSFAALPSTTLQGVVTKVTFPILAQIQDDDKRLLMVYRRYIRIMAIVIFFPMVMLAAIGKPLTLILLTDKWTDCIPYLQVLCFAMMFDFITSINMNLLQVKGYSGLILKTETIKKAISCIIVFSAIPFGVIYVCVARVIYTQIAIIISTYYTGKIFGLSYRKQFADFIPYFIQSILSAIPAYLLCEICPNSYISLPLGILVMTVSYFLLIKRDTEFKELLEMIKSKIKK